MYDYVLTLIKRNDGDTDDLADRVITESKRDVFCDVRSIIGKELYQAQAVGMQPEIKFVLSDYLDYEGEELFEFEGKRYRLLRPYRNGREQELICYRGVNPYERT